MMFRYVFHSILFQLIAGQLFASANLNGRVEIDELSHVVWCFSSDSLIDSIYHKKHVVWYTPCRVEEINGLALSFMLEPYNIKNDDRGTSDSLLIRGVNLQVNPLITIIVPYLLLIPVLDGELPDDEAAYRQTQNSWDTKIHGLNLSIATVGDVIISGLNITGTVTLVDEMHGLTISGISNFAYIMNGLSVSGIRNKATCAKGVQIGLYNKATSLRGVQIGLWNVNAKRRLPFINWQFIN